MNFRIHTLLYATSLVATGIAGFGVGGLLLVAAVLSMWRLAFPGIRPLGKWAEILVAGYAIVTMSVLLMFGAVWGLTGWSFDPAEYDPAPLVCKLLFGLLAIAPMFWWVRGESQARRRFDRQEVQLPTDFPENN